MTPTTTPRLFGLTLTLTLTLTLSLTLALPTGSGGVPQCPQVNSADAVSWLADPDDCSAFYMCHGSRRFTFDCGANIWDPETKTCVGKGSQWDKCSIAKELDALNGLLPSGHSGDVCSSNPTAVSARADNCAQYYDCASREATVAKDPRVMECEFPLLFNADSKRCEHFDMVKCGDRKEPLDACDYAKNSCEGRAHCVPCSVRFPSCRGLSDGLNPWLGREFSPFFVLCDKQRPLYHGACDNSKGTQLFNPVKRVCEEMKEN